MAGADDKSTGGKQWDRSKATFESWPWMFGMQWKTIFEDVRAHGISACSGSISTLVLWCRPFFTKEQKNQLDALRDGEPKTEEEVAAINGELLAICMEVASRVKAWEYERPRVTRYEETAEDLGRELA